MIWLSRILRLRTDRELTLHCMELPSPTATNTDVVYVARFDHIMQGCHGLFNLRNTVDKFGKYTT